MRIVTYRELQSKDELLPLFQHFFRWPFNPKEFEKTIMADSRLKNSSVGYAAIEDNHIVGFVGVMDIATRTLKGSEETVGGIWGVVTRPAYTRRGIFKTLMQRCHEYFKEKGYKFSLLNTSKVLIAYAFYQKLGYSDAIVYARAYKVIKETKKRVKKSSRKVKLDWNKILKIYNQTTKDRTGFVVRDRQYGRMLETCWKRIQPENCVVSDEGYVLLKDDEGSMTIQELQALTKEEAGRLVTKVEETARKTIIDQTVLDKTLQKIYQSHGFMLLEDSYDVLMSKPLTDKEFKETYGNEFYATAVDFF
jgi:predicted acetyltransferase